METKFPTSRTFLVVYVALLALLGATMVAVAFPLGRLGVVVALTIAAIKVALIYWFFMNGRRDDAPTRLFACSGLLFLAILFAIVSADYLTR